jgi:predicted transcriptional regulator
MEYTIKEIADTVGVSKTAVRKKIEKLGLQTKLLKNGNKITIDEETAKQVIMAFDKQTENETQTRFANQNENELSKVIEILQAELESKNKQLASKDRQIEDLTRALENTTASLQAEQALHAGTMQKQLSSGEEQEQAEDQEKTKTDKKRHWWQFHK